jgi:hypothetical protein
VIANRERTILLSSMAWVDGATLWAFDVSAGKVETIPLGVGGQWLSLHASDSERFAVTHHGVGGGVEVTVRTFAAPGVAVARAIVADGETRLVGDPAAWADVPRVYTCHLAFAPWNDDVLIRVSPSTERVEIQRLEWYDGSYDKMYQGIVGVLALPGTHLALVSVQRSDRLVLHDIETGKRQGFVGLAGRGGNPDLALRNGSNELWASDYDTLVVVHTGDWRVLRSRRMQPASGGTHQFIGRYSFAPDDGACVVARPFNGDVVAVDPATLKIKGSAGLGRQPLEVAALPRGEIVARDWKTGALLRGRLQPLSWIRRFPFRRF